MRKLATIRKIDAVRPIEGADAIECAVLGGWTVVIKRGEYQAGDLAVYLEIDSWVPHDLVPFLSKGQAPREYNGVKGERLRSIRLRGQLSQGLLLPIDVTFFRDPGTDVTEALGIQKWEAPVPAQLAGEVKGVFPVFIPKTDQERVQNLTAELEIWKEKNYTWEATEKLDGCVFAGTMVSTPNGNIMIESVNVGDTVVTFNHTTGCEENGVITGVLHRSIETEWVEIEFENGTTLTVTKNHPIFLSELGCYRRADQLKIGDVLTKKV